MLIDEAQSRAKTIFEYAPRSTRRALDGGGRRRAARARAGEAARDEHDELVGSEGPALGSDPFTQSDGTLPYLLRLREASMRMVTEARAQPRGRERTHAAPRAARTSARRSRSCRASTIATSPRARSTGWRAGCSRAPTTSAWRSSFAPLDGRPYDEFGMSPRVARRALAFFKLLYKYWFRVESSGHARDPREGRRDPGREPRRAARRSTRPMVVATGSSRRSRRAWCARWSTAGPGSLPFVNVFYARVGQVIGSRDNVRELLAPKQLVLIFPEGMAGIRKRAADRYVLQPFHLGFVEESLRHRVPIIPVAIVGADDQAPLLWDAAAAREAARPAVLPDHADLPAARPARTPALPRPLRDRLRRAVPFPRRVPRRDRR